MSQTKEEYEQMPVEKLYEIARKRGVRNDDTMDKEELINMIVGYEKEDEGESPEENEFSAKPPTPPSE